MAKFPRKRAKATSGSSQTSKKQTRSQKCRSAAVSGSAREQNLTESSLRRTLEPSSARKQRLETAFANDKQKYLI